MCFFGSLCINCKYMVDETDSKRNKEEAKNILKYKHILFFLDKIINYYFFKTKQNIQCNI